MSELEHLADALRERLHALVADLDPSAELRARIDAIPERPRPRRRFERLRRRRFALALPVPIAALAAAAVLVFGAADTPSSFAGGIRVLGNGQVVVTMSQISGVDAANAVLRRHHIHNMVIVPLTASCSNHDMTYSAASTASPPVVTLTPSAIAPGYTVVMGARKIARGWLESATGRFKGRVPTCASSHGTGPGMGNLLRANRRRSR